MGGRSNERLALCVDGHAVVAVARDTLSVNVVNVHVDELLYGCAAMSAVAQRTSVSEQASMLMTESDRSV